jgi:formylglycine-generating enzyme required for sulfatase activity
MVVVPAGSFNMGGNGQYDGQPIHKVTFSQPFAIGKTEVTQGQWIALMGNNPSHFINCGDNCPVENISWNDANEYIKKLNKRIGKQYRLPSEAEWEYACRAGGQGEYCGESIVYSDFTRSVAQGKANAWGLFEMSGSVWEWVEDSFHDDYNSAPIDGTAWKGLPWGNGKLKIIRGGSYREPQYGAASRLWQNPDETSGYHFGLGFRIATSLLIPGRN